MNKKEILPQQVVPGKTYSFSGDIKNGCYADGTPRISHEGRCVVIPDAPSFFR